MDKLGLHVAAGATKATRHRNACYDRVLKVNQITYILYLSCSLKVTVMVSAWSWNLVYWSWSCIYCLDYIIAHSTQSNRIIVSDAQTESKLFFADTNSTTSLTINCIIIISPWTTGGRYNRLRLKFLFTFCWSILNASTKFGSYCHPYGHEFTANGFTSVTNSKPDIKNKCHVGLYVMFPYNVALSSVLYIALSFLDITYRQEVLFSEITRCSRRWQISPPVPPCGELPERYATSSILSNIRSNMSSTKLIAFPLEEDPSMSNGNVCSKFGENWTRSFRDMRADRQTNRDTDKHTRWSQYFAPYWRRSNKRHEVAQKSNSRQKSKLPENKSRFEWTGPSCGQCKKRPINVWPTTASDLPIQGPVLFYTKCGHGAVWPNTSFLFHFQLLAMSYVWPAKYGANVCNARFNRIIKLFSECGPLILFGRTVWTLRNAAMRLTVRKLHRRICRFFHNRKQSVSNHV